MLQRMKNDNISTRGIGAGKEIKKERRKEN